MPSNNRGGGRAPYRPPRGRGRQGPGRNGTPAFADVAQMVVAAAGVITSLINAVSDYSRRQQAETQQNSENPGQRDDGALKCMICKLSGSQLRNLGVEIVATPCGHVYCRVCVVQALRDKPECPNCRKKISIQQLNTLHI